MDKRQLTPCSANEIISFVSALAGATFVLFVLYAFIAAPAHVPCYDDCYSIAQDQATLAVLKDSGREP